MQEGTASSTGCACIGPKAPERSQPLRPRQDQLGNKRGMGGCGAVDNRMGRKIEKVAVLPEAEEKGFIP